MSLVFLMVWSFLCFVSTGECGTGNAVSIIPRVLKGADVSINNMGKAVRNTDVIVAKYDLDLHEVSINGSLGKDMGGQNLVEYSATPPYWPAPSLAGVSFEVDAMIMGGGEMKNAFVLIGNSQEEIQAWRGNPTDAYKIILDADLMRISILHEKNGLMDRNWIKNWPIKVGVVYRILVINSTDTTYGQPPAQGTIIIREVVNGVGSLPTSKEIVNSNLGAMGFQPKDFSKPGHFGFYVGSYLSKARFWNESIVTNSISKP